MDRADRASRSLREPAIRARALIGAVVTVLVVASVVWAAGRMWSRWTAKTQIAWDQVPLAREVSPETVLDLTRRKSSAFPAGSEEPGSLAHNRARVQDELRQLADSLEHRRDARSRNEQSAHQQMPARDRSAPPLVAADVRAPAIPRVSGDNTSEGAAGPEQIAENENSVIPAAAMAGKTPPPRSGSSFAPPGQLANSRSESVGASSELANPISTETSANRSRGKSESAWQAKLPDRIELAGTDPGTDPGADAGADADRHSPRTLVEQPADPTGGGLAKTEPSRFSAGPSHAAASDPGAAETNSPRFQPTFVGHANTIPSSSMLGPEAAATRKAAAWVESLDRAAEVLETVNESPRPGATEADSANENTVVAMPRTGDTPPVPGVADRKAQAPTAFPPDADRLVNPATTTRSREGETLWAMAQRVYGDGIFFAALYRENEAKIGPIDSFRPGLDLVTPPASALLARYPELFPGRAAENQATFTSDSAVPASLRIYRTLAGDTLFDIARRQLGQASRYAEIHSLNADRLSEQTGHLDPLPAGLELRIPD